MAPIITIFLKANKTGDVNKCDYTLRNSGVVSN